MIATALTGGKSWLDPEEAGAVLAACGLPLVAERLAGDPDEAAFVAASIGLPVALKIRSPDITHKSGLGGVALIWIKAARHGLRRVDYGRFIRLRAMIFILDDNQATRDSLRLLLECEGLAAREFASGREFLEQARPQAGDCLLLDLHMPGMSGLDVLEALRRRGDHIPVIVVTGQPSASAERRTTAAGALAFVKKPYRADELLGLIDTALNRGPPKASQ